MTLVNLTSFPCSSITLIDSRAEVNFLDIPFSKSHGLATVPFEQTLNATASDGRLLFTVTHCSPSVNLDFCDARQELVSFNLFNACQHPIILGYLWLIEHEPYID